MKRKVYRINLKKHEPFLFYYKDGKVTNIANNKYPRPRHCKNVWNKNGTWTKIVVDYIETISVPTWLVKKDELDDCVLSQVQQLIETYGYSKEGNVIIVTKQWEDGYLELGMFAVPYKASRRYMKIENYINRIEKLKAFS